MTRQGNGEKPDTDVIFEHVYDELRRVAAVYLRSEQPNHTLQPTALVHEVYLKLATEDQFQWNDPAHFRAIAAVVMRRVLVNSAKARGAIKRGGGLNRVTLSFLESSDSQQIDVLALDAALLRLSELDERQSRIVELKFFGGLTTEETARLLDVSERTAHRDWIAARAWLRGQMAAVVHDES